MVAAYNAILPRPFNSRQQKEVPLRIILSQEWLQTHSSLAGEILARLAARFWWSQSQPAGEMTAKSVRSEVRSSCIPAV
jgi:hypothetical protein